MKFLFSVFVVMMSIDTYAKPEKNYCNIAIDTSREAETILQAKFISGRSNLYKFQVPKTSFSCNLKFFDSNSGTVLTCFTENDPLGPFVQSDRSLVREKHAQNNLRLGGAGKDITIKVQCN